MPPPALALHLLGTPAVEIAGAAPPTDVLWRKNLALLAYLALSPHMSRSRAHLQALLWPEKDTTRARHSLNEAVRRLRAGLGAERMHSHGDAVTLDPRELTVDVLDAAALESDGELLDGFSLPDAAAFEEWLAAARRDLRRRRVEARLAAAEEALAAGCLLEARKLAHAALALDPLAEPAAAVAMRAAALHGDRATALRIYEEFAAHLEREVGAAPGPGLGALARRIRDGGWRTPPRVQGPAVPLVGRSEVHEQVFDLVRAALSGRPTVLAVAGDSGQGKSRLLDEIADRWRLEGGTAVTALPVEQDQRVEWSSLRELCRRGLAAAPGLPGAAPEAVAALAALVPDIRSALPPAPPRDIAEAGTALRAVFTAIAEEAPLAVLLDAADTADEHTLAALQAAFSDLDDGALLLVVGHGAAPGELPAFTTFASRIGREMHGAEVRLRPLAPDDVRALVDALAPWCPDPVQRDRLSRRLHFETGGSPLLLVTVLQGLAEIGSLRDDALEWPPPRQTLEAPMPDGIPHLARLVTAARVQQLDERSRAFLVAACVGGRVVDPELTRTLASLDDGQTDAALTDLEQRGFLAFDGEHYVFPAPLIARTIATVLLTRGERHRLEARRADLIGDGR